MARSLDDKKQEVLETCLLELGQAVEVARRRLRAYGLRSSLDQKETKKGHEIRIDISELD
jgi:hypothetical protein